MLLVRCKSRKNMNITDYDQWRWGDDIRLVVAIGGDQYAIDTTGIGYYPRFYSLDSLEVVYGSIPKTWKRSSDRAEWNVTSFEQWAEDEYFYGNLVDNYDKVASKRAWDVYRNYVDSQLKEFAIDNFGSVEKAQEIVTKAEREKLIMDYRARGFEIPEEREEPTPLTFDNLFRAYERLNKKTN